MWHIVTSYGITWEDLNSVQRDEVRADHPGIHDDFFLYLKFVYKTVSLATRDTVPAPPPAF